MNGAFDFGKWVRAVEAKDVDALASFFADEVEFHSDLLEQPLRGREIIRQLAEQAMPAIGSIRMKPVVVLQKGDQIAALVETTVKYDRDLDLPGVHLGLAGKGATIHSAMFATLNEAGQIVWFHQIRDTLSAVKQLGLRLEDLDRIRSQVLQAATA